MKAYIWKKLDVVSSCYHPGGGVVILAGELDEALKLGSEEGVKFSRREWSGESKTYVWFECNSPDLELLLDGEYEPQVIVFRDAGCC
jgi:hypothetical protein